MVRWARSNPGGRHVAIPDNEGAIVGMVSSSACRLLIGRACHVTCCTYSDEMAELRQSRPGLLGGRIGLAHARDEVMMMQSRGFPGLHHHDGASPNMCVSSRSSREFQSLAEPPEAVVKLGWC